MKNTPPVNLFVFERDEFGDLNWMPLAFRYRLDLCGLKLPLSTWQRLDLTERIKLLERPCRTEAEIAAWASRLKIVVSAVGREEPATLMPWRDPTEIPPDVQARLTDLGSGMQDSEWRLLKPLQRYVLCKLAQSRQGERFFSPALREFGIHPRPM